MLTFSQTVKVDVDVSIPFVHATVMAATPLPTMVNVDGDDRTSVIPALDDVAVYVSLAL